MTDKVREIWESFEREKLPGLRRKFDEVVDDAYRADWEYFAAPDRFGRHPNVAYVHHQAESAAKDRLEALQKKRAAAQEKKDREEREEARRAASSLGPRSQAFTRDGSLRLAKTFVATAPDLAEDYVARQFQYAADMLVAEWNAASGRANGDAGKMLWEMALAASTRAVVDRLTAERLHVQGEKALEERTSDLAEKNRKLEARIAALEASNRSGAGDDQAERVIRLIAELEAELWKCKVATAQAEAQKWVGTWKEDTEYKVGNLLTHAGGLWVCTEDCLGQRPGRSDHFRLIAKGVNAAEVARQLVPEIERVVAEYLGRAK